MLATRTTDTQEKMTVGIIGAGWYGVHTALTLAQAGYDVTIIDKDPEPFRGISGKFGVRLHTGQHYPRSEATRERCRIGFEKFKESYPELVNEHEYSIYALGKEDAEGKPPKVAKELFTSVCKESTSCSEVSAECFGYSNLESVMNIPEEPSLVLGNRLRKFFVEKLSKNSIACKFNFCVNQIEKDNGKILVTATKPDSDHMISIQTAFLFTRLVNASSFKSHIPRSLPFNMGVVYQVCLALIYRDITPREKPFSFIVMDGWFPCIMPYDRRENDQTRIDTYLLTHAKYTNLASYESFQEAKNFMEISAPNYISNIKENSEREASRHWTGFQNRFHYIGYSSEVLVKAKTEKEFRSAATFESEGIVYVIPGKVSNIFDVADEVGVLLKNSPGAITEDGVFRYASGGVLDKAREEIMETRSGDRNTCDLETYREYDESKGPAIYNKRSYATAFRPVADERNSAEQETVFGRVSAHF